MSIGAFPLLLWCAVNKEKITYEELNQYLLNYKFSDVDYKGSSKRFIGHPAGLVGEYMLALGLPVINSLLVQRNTGIPGSGAEDFIEEHLNQTEHEKYENLTAAQKRKFLEDHIWSKIYAHDWEPVLRINNIDLSKIEKSDFSLSHLEQTEDKSLKSTQDKFKEEIGGRKYGVESEEHKRLKDLVLECVAQIPALAKKGFLREHGEKEYLLPSADRIDVCFKNEHEVMGVEVKSIKSDDADICRGIYQCIKYKHLLQAELLVAGKFPHADSLLIVQRDLTPELKDLAKRLSVKYYILK